MVLVIFFCDLRREVYLFLPSFTKVFEAASEYFLS